MRKFIVGIMMLFFMTTAAQAQVGCNDGNIAGTFDWGTNVSYVDCFGAVTGNTSEQTLIDIQNTWGIVDGFPLNWISMGKSDDTNFGPFTNNPSVSTGTLSLDIPYTGLFAIALKSSNSYSVYLLNGTTVESVNFFTDGTAINGAGLPHNLSHAELFTTTEVPEPFTVLLVITGLGILWSVRRNFTLDKQR